jgi:hypothetical protein
MKKGTALIWPAWSSVPRISWGDSPSREGDLNPEGKTGNAKINHATEKLHDAIDALGPPRNITYVGTQEIRWGSYDNVLDALRELVRAGGRPFEDETFTRFFNFLLSPMRVFRYKTNPPENEELKTFVKTAVRICGGEIKPDGAISLVRLSAKRRVRIRN